MEDQQPDRCIDLNVGGTPFKTSLTTLLKGDTMLSAMFSGRMPIQEEENGSVFIDRDGKHFNVILNFLRDGQIAFPETQKELEELKREARFYCIEDLVKVCESDNNPISIKERKEQEDQELLSENLEKILAAIVDLNSRNLWLANELRFTYQQNQQYFNSSNATGIQQYFSRYRNIETPYGYLYAHNGPSARPTIPVQRVNNVELHPDNENERQWQRLAAALRRNNMVADNPDDDNLDEVAPNQELVIDADAALGAGLFL